MSDQNTFKLGTHNAVCDVCGFKYKADELRERWDGAIVCEPDWEPRHPQDFVRSVSDDMSPDGLVNPEPVDDFVSVTYADSDEDTIPAGTFDDGTGGL